MKALVLVFVTTFYFFAPITAQKSHSASPELEWRVIETADNIAFNFGTAFQCQNGILYLNESEAILPVTYKRKEFGLVKMLKTGKAKWEKPIGGYILGTALKNGNIFVLYTPDWESEIGRIIIVKELHAALLNPENGNIIADKLIYTNTIKKHLEARIAKRPSSEIDHITIRNMSFSMETVRKDLPSETSNFQAIYLDNQLNTEKIVPINSSFLNNMFFGEQVNEAGESFLVSQSGTDIVVQKFGPGFEKSEKLSRSLGDSKASGIFPLLRIDKNNPEAIIFTINHLSEKKRANSILRFDFSTKKVQSHLQESTKEYSKSLDWIKIDGVKAGNKNMIEDLKIVRVVQLADKIILVKEMQHSYSTFDKPTASRRYRDGIVISQYNHEMKLVKEIAIDKNHEVMSDEGLTLAANIVDEKLHIFNGVIVGIMRYGTTHCIVNLKTMTLEKSVLLDREGFEFHEPIEGASTVWLGKTVLLNYLVAKGLAKRDINTKIQRVDLCQKQSFFSFFINQNPIRLHR